MKSNDAELTVEKIAKEGEADGECLRIQTCRLDRGEEAHYCALV